MSPAAWKARVAEMLRAGYGVEDIAIETGEELSEVRRFLANLRKAGTLHRTLGLQKEAPRKGGLVENRKDDGSMTK